MPVLDVPTAESPGTVAGRSGARVRRSLLAVLVLRRDGTEIDVGGPASSVCTLGRILVGAGVVRGMERDINPNRISGAYFHARPKTRCLRPFPAEQVSPQHHFSPSSRDSFAWFLR
ncbi:hypothetical protein [Pseudonocardia xishanensis]|uniref:Uncharacterized protein n=1 Tax=Pseudonocardia xishanensis TaxID=630995 RepID=A0ABP8S1A2_9PSEU